MSMLWVLIGISLGGFFVLIRWSMSGMLLTCRATGCDNSAYDGGYCVGCWEGKYA